MHAIVGLRMVAFSSLIDEKAINWAGSYRDAAMQHWVGFVSRGQVVEERGLAKNPTWEPLRELLSNPRGNCRVYGGVAFVINRTRQSIEGSYSGISKLQHWVFLFQGTSKWGKGSLLKTLPENLSEKLSTEVTVGLTGGSRFCKGGR